MWRRRHDPVRFLLSGRGMSLSPSRTALPCGHRSYELPTAPPSFLNPLPSDRAVFKNNTCSGGYGTRYPPRSGDRRRHCVPRLASYRSPTEPGSHELPAPPRGDGETTCMSSDNRGLTPNPRSEAATCSRQYIIRWLYLRTKRTGIIKKSKLIQRLLVIRWLATISVNGTNTWKYIHFGILGNSWHLKLGCLDSFKIIIWFGCW